MDPIPGEIPRLFQIRKIWKSLNRGLKFQRRVILGKKKAPARNAPGARRMGFNKIQGFSGFGSNSRFGSKDLSNPKDDKTKDDAMSGVYPLEGPKPIICSKTFGKSRELVQHHISEKAWKSPKMSFPKSPN